MSYKNITNKNNDEIVKTWISGQKSYNDNKTKLAEEYDLIDTVCHFGKKTRRYSDT